ncbi:MAG: chromosome segregation SMC family protein [Bacilli bacterium]
MYLKEIKASGFKSFADKINLNLDDNITCVVGPNGSGKSNIVDAVKWVLGEQSVKTLRGTNNMSDIIFSGSKSRKPLNLASVTLVFDNSDSYLKVPYTEISITRKVYRSGENEYFINNEKCRLKDINNLFIDSGIGKYAFNIISQGEVGNIINSSPYERRAIFEEAAGVLKYKKRKEEALRKLDKTKDNMTRIKDIITELDTQIEPLKIQREEALKYLDYQEKLSDVEIALIVHDLEKLNTSFHENEEKIEKTQNEIAHLMTSSSTSDASLEEIKESLNKTNEKIANLNKEYIELTKELERLNGEKNILNERSKYQSTDIKVHENITNLKEKSLSLNNELSSLKNDLEIISLKEENFLNDLENIYKNLKDKENEKNHYQSNLSLKSKKLTEISYKIKYLTDYIEQGGGINPNVKKVLSNPKLSGIHNTISDLIETEDKYLVALSVALASAKDYIVVNTRENAKSAINFLKENNLGRVTFFPLEVIKSRFIDNSTLELLKQEQGFINTFDRIVKCDQKYENIIKNQLGNVILVDNIDNANRISKIINNRYRIVTLTGEVINVGGSITGGKIKTSSIISEKYELQKLTNEKEKLEEEIKNLKELENSKEKQQKEIQNKVFEKEKEKVILEEEKKSKQEQYYNLTQEQVKTNKELESFKALINDNIKDEEEKVLQKYYEVMAKKQEVEKRSKQELLNKEKIEAKIDELEASFRINNTKIRELEKTLKESEINNSKTSVKMDNLLNNLSETYQMTFEKAKSNYILEIDEDIARKRVNEYKRVLSNIGNVNVGAIEEYDRISTRYEFLTKQNSDLEEASKTLLKIISELDEVMKAEFIRAFKQIQIEFDKVFKELFKGGEAKLELTDKNDLLETGVNIIVTPPGKKLSSINLLSGGEKTLTAISLLFAILNIKRIPFCLFDEVEAALDEANVDRFGSYLKKYNGKTQLIIITHKKKTMEYANTLYGITMQESGVSKLVSVKLVD